MTDLRFGLTLTADGKGLVGEVRIAKEEVDRLGEEVRKTGEEFSKTGGEAGKSGSEVGKSGDEFRKTGGEVRKTGDEARKTGGEFRKTGGEVRKAGGTAARQAPKFDRLRRSIRSARDAGSRLRREFIGIKAAAGGIAFGALIRQATQTALAYERIDLALAAATGSMMTGREEMDFVRDHADRLGLALQPVSLQYSRIAAAAIGTNLQGQGVRDIFLGVAEAAGALSLSAAQTDGLMNAVEQTMSRGVVSAEEVRRQMGIALPGAFNIAASAMGVTPDEFNKMRARGEVLSDEI
ncbi:MAG: tape measure protein [Gammaproteobacteria bacterium]|nr:tape measure protein [Gammaproteobacteria bacterium]